MSYDEEHQKRSRFVVETPTARREVVQSQTVRYPEERRGYSVGIVAAVALTAIAATVIIMLFVLNPRDDSETTINANLRAAAPVQPTPYTQAPVMVQTPLTQPTPIIIQQPATAAPIIVAPPPSVSTGTTTAEPPSSTVTVPPASSGASASDDVTLQQRVDKLFDEDREVAAANVFATVVNGRVQLTGTAPSEAVKQRAERLAASVRGVLGVDNRITVTPQ